MTLKESMGLVIKPISSTMRPNYLLKKSVHQRSKSVKLRNNLFKQCREMMDRSDSYNKFFLKILTYLLVIKKKCYLWLQEHADGICQFF